MGKPNRIEAFISPEKRVSEPAEPSQHTCVRVFNELLSEFNGKLFWNCEKVALTASNQLPTVNDWLVVVVIRTFMIAQFRDRETKYGRSPG